MSLEIRQESAATLSEYQRIPIAFQVREVFDVTAEPKGGFSLAARQLANPYQKDYDALGETPADWVLRFDVSTWAFFSAFTDGQRIGGATVAFRSPDVDMLEGRVDLAVLWDIRVAPSTRRGGVGSALFAAATTWAASQRCRQLRVETQNINVPACRFYGRQGCVLGAARWGAYPDLPEEVQLLWYKDLAPDAIAG